MSVEATSASLLEVTGVHCSYEGITAVRDVSLTVGAGEVIALFGPNGAGKTTLLRMISGLLELDRGQVTIAGTSIAGLTVGDRCELGLAHVPESRGIFHGLTVADHFRLYGRQGEHRASIAYDHFPALAELRDRRVGLLSGGEQQMLAVGLALSGEPRLLLIDEMSLGLAPVIVQRLLPIIRRFADESHAGVLLVEQHVQLALEIVDRGYVLTHGEIRVHADAATLRADRRLLLSSYLGTAAQSPEAG